MIDTQQDNTRSPDTQGDDGEPDMEPSGDDQAPTRQPQKITPPSSSETAASLGLLGAGQPYRNLHG